MKERKQSFLERLTGTQTIEDDIFDDIEEEREDFVQSSRRYAGTEESQEEELDTDAGLPIDMYETDDELVIESMIAGVTPDNLHIAITNDSISISGKRLPRHNTPDHKYFDRELYWGTFSREIPLPFEVDTENADAIEKFGLLVIRLPKLYKDRKQIIKVKSLP